MLSIIVAVDENFLIGNGNDLPWNEPADLKYFKKITMGHSLLMGYNTYLSIVNRIGKTLPGRTSYVLTYEKELIADSMIDDMVERVGARETIKFLLNLGVSNEVILALKFDTEDLNEALEENALNDTDNWSEE